MVGTECSLASSGERLRPTFQQAKQLGGFVRRGEHATGVVYISRFRKKETDDDDAEVQKKIPFLKEYHVFNTDQCEGLPQQFSTHVKSTVRPRERRKSNNGPLQG